MTTETISVRSLENPPRRQLLSQRFEFKPAESSSKQSATQRQMLAEFIRRVENEHYRLIHEACPCASQPSDLLISEIDRYGLPLSSVLCLECGTVRIDPYLDAASLENFYRELYQDLYGRALEPAAYFERQRAYGRKVLATAMGNDSAGDRSVLEIGCGSGGGLSEFAAAGFRVSGCDFSEPLIHYGTQSGVPDLYVGGIEEIRKRLPDARFDLIFLHHVYEHVGEPISLLQELRLALAPGGRILIIVPDLSRIDRFVNPSGNALDFFHVAHKYNYSLPGICSIAQQAGLAACRIVPPPRMKTAWSRSPELWVGMTSSDLTQNSNLVGLQGQQLWHYLQRTERLYQRGLCRAQVSTIIRNLSPERVLARLMGHDRPSRSRHAPS